ncbi:hypothetical protein N7493_009875 [Penicillium malachiteum]|uniref:ABM domain-containing protein n=1 Tax=Penicillium malachiteum TaxID=1324776 RepID=A0AAD6MS04_9EURO|nr:hypothetical protein N7493_009875 [Penicillium malachiteum]
MPVTTRSALRLVKAAKARAIKKPPSKKKKPHVNNIVAKTKGGETSPAEMLAPPRILQWITLKDPANGVISNSDEIFSILQEIQKLPECICLARGRPEELNDIEWLLIEWRSKADMEKFLTSELSFRFKEALASRPWSQEVGPLLDTAGPHIIHNSPTTLQHNIHEVLTFYFPADLHLKTIASIEKFEGLRSFGVEPEYLPEDPLSGLVINFPVMWKETCEYQGTIARRLTWFNVFLHKEGERIFKEIRHVRSKPHDVMDDMSHQLEGLGMLEYESLHTSFVQALHYVDENYALDPTNFVTTWSDTPSFPPGMWKLPPEMFEVDDSEL